ncbi:hypothetical protein M433DRAFT_157491 [Acidomyces richmondensis BFW]|nr:MAG: hypothetical protein FE78DRAFT_92574 [Acidomyces sp. 'richmondensis']KYG42779.1 hypothetical protein M433DRAFT_157491 [Acidomyces richmondensis BFW]
MIAHHIIPRANTWNDEAFVRTMMKRSIRRSNDGYDLCNLVFFAFTIFFMSPLRCLIFELDVDFQAELQHSPHPVRLA